MNHIVLTGRVADEPRISYSADYDPVAHAAFSVAVPDRTRRKDESGNYPTDFFRCCCWGKIAEAIEMYCSKGTKLLIVGKLKNNNYEKNGQRFYSNEIVIESFEFMEAKQAESGKGGTS